MASDIKAFRRYYNDHLYGELRRLERARIGLVLLLVFSSLLLGALLTVIMTTDIPALAMALWLPIVFWSMLVYWRVRVFKNNFKPRVLPIILAFLDPALRYYPREFIPRDTFLRSGIFGITPQEYKGEDYIKGQMGLVNFEMSELDVRHPSEIQGRLVRLFRGIFFHAVLPGNFPGRVLILPKEDKQFHSRTIRRITKIGGERVDGLNPGFDELFVVYAQQDVNPQHLLTPEMLESFAEFRRRSRKRLYLSFADGHFFAALEEPYDLLEPNILTPNLNFDLMVEFYTDLALLTGLVESFDLTH